MSPRARAAARVALVLGGAGLGLTLLAAGLARWPAITGAAPDFSAPSFGPLLLGASAWLVAGALGGPRLRLLLSPADRARSPGPLALGFAMMGVHALNLALPGPAGDLALLAALRRRGVGLAEAAGATLAGRALGLGAIGGLTLIALPWVGGGGAVGAGLKLGLLPAALGACGIGAAALRPGLLLRAVEAPLRAVIPRVPGLLRVVLEKAAMGAAALRDRLAAGADPGDRAKLVAALISVLMQVFLGLSLACAAASTGPLPALLPLGLAHLAGELASVALAFAPAGLGALEGALGGGLHAFCGLGLGAAASVVLAMRAVQVLALALGAPLAAGALPELLSPAPPRG